MKLPRIYSLSEIAALISAEFIGDSEFKISGINEIHMVEEGDIAFVDHPKYYDKTLASKASVIIIDKQVECPAGKALIVHAEPFKAFNYLTRYFQPIQAANQMISPSANIGEGTVIMPNVFIGNDVTIGKNCRINPGTVIYDRTTIGDNVIVHANVTLGSDAFYYKRGKTGHQKFNTVGKVILQDNVEIGAACTIDAGSTGETIIGEGTKIDNHVHVGHDTKIGKRCIIAAQVGIAGCAIIEDDVVIWGQVGITANVTIKKGAQILAQSGVMRTVEENQSVFGSPAMDSRLKMRELATISNLSRNK